jgi:hypothetical protein
MSRHRVFSALAAAGLVAALGCSGGDLTLPTPDEPATLIVVSGDGQRAEAGGLVEQPLTVRVMNAAAHPVAGALVHFSFLGELPGAGLDPASVLTDEEGRAEAIVRLGEVVGEQVIVAQVSDTERPELRARFSLIAIDPGDGRGGGKKGDKAKPHGGDPEDSGDGD